MTLRLQPRYLLTIVSLVMLTVVSLSVLMMWQFDQSTDRIRQLGAASLQEHLEQQVRDRGDVLVTYLAQDVARPLAELDMVGMQQLIAKAQSQSDVQYVFVFDAQRHLVHDGSEQISRYGQSLDVIIGTPGDEIGTQKIVGFERPVHWQGSDIGGVHVGLALDAIAAETREMTGALDALIAQGKQKNWAKVASISGLFLVLSTLAALMITRGLVGPIRRLADYASAVGHGNYEEPLVVSRRDELGDLACAR